MKYPKPKQKSTARKKVRRLKVSDVQRVFNSYIRKRDSKDGLFTCISCGRTLPTEKMNAGHFVPVSRSSALRFNEWNTNGECMGCNNFDEFHLVPYRKHLIEKIGADAVRFLEEHPRDPKQWKQYELRKIYDNYLKENYK